MEIRPIHTDADCKAALCEVSAYFDNEPEPGTPDGDRFEILLTLVEAYEARHFPIDLPDPVKAIKFQILARKRPLTLNMIWRLHESFGIPAESLIRPPRLSASDR